MIVIRTPRKLLEELGLQPAATQCSACQTGQFQSATGRSRCEKCTNGTFANTKGSLSCTACEAGRVSEKQGASNCTACSMGRSQSASGQRKCDECTAGTYMNEEGSINYKNCKAGTVSALQGATACDSCVAGKYQAATCADPGSGRAGHGAPQLLSEGGARVQRLEEARRGGSPFSSSREPLLSRFICADQPSEWRQAKLVLLLRSPPVFSSTPRPGFYVALVSLALFPADRDLPFPSRTGLTAPPAARHAARMVLGLAWSWSLWRLPRLWRDDVQAAAAESSNGAR